MLRKFLSNNNAETDNQMPQNGLL